ncbi:MAG TPA: hypothetical protein QGG37_12565 [Chloroflexota bacterium]|nr:hypothetical protein [Chloroflexota bacterium]
MGHVHLADPNRLNPGRGHLDFVPGLRALADANYDGVIALECRLESHPIAELRYTVEFVRSLLE